MKNTIKINGKTYRCRDEKCIPLEIYLDCNVGKEYPHSLRFISYGGDMTMTTLNSAFKVYARHERACDLIEVKSKTDQLIDLLKLGKAKGGVLCRVWDNSQARAYKGVIVRYRETDTHPFMVDGGGFWRYAEPLTDEEIDKMRFSRLMEEK